MRLRVTLISALASIWLLSGCRSPLSPIVTTGSLVPSATSSPAETRGRAAGWLERSWGPGESRTSQFPIPVALEARAPAGRLVLVATFDRDVPSAALWHLSMDLRAGDSGLAHLSAGTEGLALEPGDCQIEVQGRRVTLSCASSALSGTPDRISLFVQDYGDGDYRGFDFYLAALRWPRA